jgi:hypothetical protein
MAVDGTYDITLGTPMGDRPGKLVLTTDGAGLSGSFEGPQGNQAFDGGTVDGDDVAWRATVSGQMGEMKIDFAGKIDGDEIGGTVQFGSFGSGRFKGTRV